MKDRVKLAEENYYENKEFLGCVYLLIVLVLIVPLSCLTLYIAIQTAEDQSIKLSLDPSKIAINLTTDEEYIEIISVTNIGKNLTNIIIEDRAYDYSDTQEDWLNLSDRNISLNKTEVKFVQLDINAANRSIGVHRGCIEILVENKVTETIPIILQVVSSNNTAGS